MYQRHSPGYSLRPMQFFLLFALCCLLPVAAAKLALSLSLFSPGANNKGAWVAQELHLSSLATGRWQLLYVQAERCDQRCELASYSLQQFYRGLGPKREQVSVGFIAPSAPTTLAQYPDVRWQLLPSAFPPALRNQLLLTNRQGQVLLHYDAAETPQQAAIINKKMRADLLRLLAFDRPVAMAQVE